jgi:Molybdopterin-guanine dinucleotide biosynthesis protein A
MGRDKALLPLAGIPHYQAVPLTDAIRTQHIVTTPTFLTHQVALLSVLCSEVVLVVRDEEQASLYASLYRTLPATLHIVLDQQPELGPLMGLYSGLSQLGTLGADCALVTAVDTPLLQLDCARWLLAQASANEIVMPVVDDIPQVLLALYPRASVPIIAELLRAGERSPRALLRVASTQQLAVRYIAEAQLRTIDPQLRSFHDVDTPAEFSALQQS